MLFMAGVYDILINMGIRTIQNRVYGGIILGKLIRGSINKDRTFRVRPGNGYLPGDTNDVYQDQYAYFVPASINNPEGAAARTAYTAAVVNWQGFSESVKKVYNARAMARGNKMSGYNLYLGEYISANA